MRCTSSQQVARGKESPSERTPGEAKTRIHSGAHPGRMPAACPRISRPPPTPTTPKATVRSASFQTRLTFPARPESPSVPVRPSPIHLLRKDTPQEMGTPPRRFFQKGILCGFLTSAVSHSGAVWAGGESVGGGGERGYRRTPCAGGKLGEFGNSRSGRWPSTREEWRGGRERRAPFSRPSRAHLP